MRRRITLLQQFSLVALVTTVIIAVWLGYQVTSSIEQTAVDNARNEVAQAVRSRNPFWFNVPDPKAEFSKVHSSQQEMAYWYTQTNQLLAGYPIYRIKAWSTTNQVVWSDDPTIIGHMDPDNEELSSAVQGNVESEMTDPKKMEDER